MLTIRQFEELSLNALPAQQTIYYDGWLLRFAGEVGYPRRANSIQLLYPSLLPLDEKIDTCQAHYDARGSRTVFKMTDHAPAELAAKLEARGYVKDAHTSIQALDLAGFVGATTADTELVIEPRLTDSWMEDAANLNDITSGHAAALGLIFAQIPVTAAFARLRRDGETIALGLGVLEQGWIGLFDIVTAPSVRRQGIASALIGQLLAWGQQRGAHGAYLQVMTHNAPALALYAKLGFTEVYRYWYLQNGG